MDPNKDREVQAAFDGFVPGDVHDRNVAKAKEIGRKQAFLEDAEMAEEAAETCIRGQKSVLLALAEQIRAKAAE